MLSGTESGKGARATAAAVEIQSPVGWGRGSWEQLRVLRALWAVRLSFWFVF